MHVNYFDIDHGTTNAAGTAVNVDTIKEIVAKAVDAVRTTPTCLHNVKDTPGVA